MFRRLFAAACLLSCAPILVAPPPAPIVAAAEPARSPVRLRRQRLQVTTVGIRRRSRGKQDHPGRKGNRVTTSKRVRRKHRRAA